MYLRKIADPHRRENTQASKIVKKGPTIIFSRKIRDYNAYKNWRGYRVSIWKYPGSLGDLAFF